MQNQETVATNYETCKHIHRVSELLHKFIIELLQRADKHDLSKLEPPEVELFAKYTPSLSQLTYGSPEYLETVKQLSPALEHHYANNSHHPQHYKHGINDMNLIDIVEMFCDWKASSERHNNGNLRKSVEVNAERFGINPQLTRIFENTVHIVED